MTRYIYYVTVATAIGIISMVAVNSSPASELLKPDSVYTDASINVTPVESGLHREMPYTMNHDDSAALLALMQQPMDEPDDVILTQNFPNPFNPVTAISYQLPESSEVSLKIYDVTGSEVMQLVDDKQPAGSHSVILRATNLTSGTYLYRLETEDTERTRKMTFMNLSSE